jgi:hypothetical protein
MTDKEGKGRGQNNFELEESVWIDSSCFKSTETF